MARKPVLVGVQGLGPREAGFRLDDPRYAWCPLIKGIAVDVEVLAMFSLTGERAHRFMKEFRVSPNISLTDSEIRQHETIGWHFTATDSIDHEKGQRVLEKHFAGLMRYLRGLAARPVGLIRDVQANDFVEHLYIDDDGVVQEGVGTITVRSTTQKVVTAVAALTSTVMKFDRLTGINLEGVSGGWIEQIACDLCDVTSNHGNEVVELDELICTCAEEKHDATGGGGICEVVTHKFDKPQKLCDNCYHNMHEEHNAEYCAECRENCEYPHQPVTCSID